MRDGAKVILGSFVGAAAIYVAMAACSGDRGVAGVSDAQAQTVCTRWEVAWRSGGITPDREGATTLTAMSVPEGWEPIGISTQGAGVSFGYRRCAR